VASSSTPHPQVKPPRGRWIEPWYLAYGLLGAAVAGVAPMLLPLIVNTAGSATKVGLVMAAFNLAGITAPLWGNLADRRRIHRLLLAGGLALTGVALFLFSRHDSVGWWIVMAFLLSMGSAAASTVANLFIVEAHPEGEWDQRIGWLQTFYGGGQVLGLLIAAAVTATSSMQDYSLGLAIGAGLGSIAPRRMPTTSLRVETPSTSNPSTTSGVSSAGKTQPLSWPRRDPSSRRSATPTT